MELIIQDIPDDFPVEAAERCKEFCYRYCQATYDDAMAERIAEQLALPEPTLCCKAATSHTELCVNCFAAWQRGESFPALGEAYSQGGPHEVL